MKYLVAITLSLALVASAATNACNQSCAAERFRSGISGRITDQNGAVVMGAKVTIVARSVNARVSRISNEEGQYAADLDPGVYDVFVDANGFKKAKRKSIPVEREGRNYVDFVLELPEEVIRKVGMLLPRNRTPRWAKLNGNALTRAVRR